MSGRLKRSKDNIEWIETWWATVKVTLRIPTQRIGRISKGKEEEDRRSLLQVESQIMEISGRKSWLFEI